MMSSSPPFLRLPGELRNTIYELAFTAPKPLGYYEPKGGKERQYLYLDDTPGDPVGEDKKPIEYNKLKYVNKQMHAETVGLQLKYNDITFYAATEQEYATPSERLVEWLLSIPRTKRSWLKTISVKIQSDLDGIPGNVIPDCADLLARLTSLCNEIPSMTVKFHLPAWKIDRSKDGFDFFYAAQHVRHAFRGKGFGDLFDGDDQRHENRFGEQWRRDYEGPPTRLEDLQAGNLRYFPTISNGA